MKRLFYVLLICFTLNGIYTGIATFSNQQYKALLNEQFEQSVYIETNLGYQEFFQAIKKYSAQYTFDIQRVEYTNNEGIQARQKINLYLFLSNPDWFQKSFSLPPNCNPNQLQNGQFWASCTTDLDSQQGVFPLLYDHGDIFIYPFSDLQNHQIEGKYNLHINNPAIRIETIIEEINQDNKMIMHTEWLAQNVFLSSNQELTIFYRWVIEILLFCTILALYLYLLNSLQKEIAIKKLFGFANGKISSSIIVQFIGKPLIWTSGFSVIFFFLEIFFHHRFGNINFRLYLTTLLLFFLGFVVLITLVLMIVSAVYLFIKWHRHAALATILKGQNNIKTLFSQCVKVLSSIGIVTALIFCGISFFQLQNETRNADIWQTAGNHYAYFDLYIPDYIIKDEKKFAQINLDISKVWEQLEQTKAIMFLYTQNSILNDDKEILLNGEAIQIPFAYINKNYLQVNPILSENGQPVTSFDETNDNEITVLIPEKYKGEENYLLEKVHYKHVKDRYIAESIYNETLTGEKTDWKEQLENKNLTEKIIYIKDDQKIFSYNVLYDFVENPVMVCVNSKNMGSNVYFPSIFGNSNGIKVWYNDLDQLDSEMDMIFRTAGCEELTRRYSPLSEVNADRVFLFQSAVRSSVILLLLSLISFLISLISYLQLYLEINKKKIAIQHAFGFSLWKIHKQLYRKILLQSILLLIGVYVVYRITIYRFTGPAYLPVIFMITLLYTLLELLFSTWILKQEQKNVIIPTLKGE